MGHQEMGHQEMGHQVMGHQVSCNGVNVWMVAGDSGGVSRTLVIEVSVCSTSVWGRFFHLDVDGWLTPPRLIYGLLCVGPFVCGVAVWF